MVVTNAAGTRLVDCNIPLVAPDPIVEPVESSDASNDSVVDLTEQEDPNARYSMDPDGALRTTTATGSSTIYGLFSESFRQVFANISDANVNVNATSASVNVGATSPATSPLVSPSRPIVSASSSIQSSQRI